MLWLAANNERGGLDMGAGPIEGPGHALLRFQRRGEKSLMLMASRRLLARVLTMLALAAIPAAAQEPVPGLDNPAQLAGTWHGVIEVTPDFGLRVELRMKDDGLAGGFVSLDQADAEIPMSEVKVADGKMSFQVKSILGAYAGTWDPQAQQIKGVWNQANREMPLVLQRGEAPPKETVAAPAELLGNWKGPLKVGPVELTIVLRVFRPEGKEVPTAVVDSPDQGVSAIPVTAIRLADGVLEFENATIGARFEGKLDAQGTQITGSWTQGGNSFDLALLKVEGELKSSRPQEPQRPLPYDEEQVRIERPEADLVLAGTLTRPQGVESVPAVVLITGSGPQDRDESLMGHRPFLVLADALTRRGIAVLRVDDRGCGESTGSAVTQATTRELADDTLACVQYLRGRTGIKPDAIGLVGHSEGGLIAPIVATLDPRIAFIVLLAGPGLPGDVILSRQVRLICEAMGEEPKSIDAQVDSLEQMLSVVKTQVDPEVLKAELTRVAAETEKGMLGSGDKPNSSAGLEHAVATFSNPWFRFFVTYDPRPTLAQVRCPVLAVAGELDLQVPPDENLAAIEEIVRNAGLTTVETHKLPGLNHLFQQAKTGAPIEYGRIEETMNPAVLDLVAGWIEKKIGVR